MYFFVIHLVAVATAPITQLQHCPLRLFSLNYFVEHFYQSLHFYWKYMKAYYLKIKIKIWIWYRCEYNTDINMIQIRILCSYVYDTGVNMIQILISYRCEYDTDMNMIQIWIWYRYEYDTDMNMIQILIYYSSDTDMNVTQVMIILYIWMWYIDIIQISLWCDPLTGSDSCKFQAHLFGV